MLRSVCTAHIADQSCDLSLLRTPWENRKGIIVRIQDQIRLLLSHNARNMRAIYNALVIQGSWKLSCCDRNIFQSSKHICKLEADELYVFLLCHCKNLFSGIIPHSILSFISSSHKIITLKIRKRVHFRELPLLKNTLVHGRNYSNRSILCQPFFKRGKNSKALSRKHEQFFDLLPLVSVILL